MDQWLDRAPRGYGRWDMYLKDVGLLQLHCFFVSVFWFSNLEVKSFLRSTGDDFFQTKILSYRIPKVANQLSNRSTIGWTLFLLVCVLSVEWHDHWNDKIEGLSCMSSKNSSLSPWWKTLIPGFLTKYRWDAYLMHESICRDIHCINWCQGPSMVLWGDRTRIIH